MCILNIACLTYGSNMFYDNSYRQSASYKRHTSMVIWQNNGYIRSNNKYVMITINTLAAYCHYEIISILYSNDNGSFVTIYMHTVSLSDM